MLRLLCVVFGAVALAGCTSLGGSCYMSCGTTHAGSTSLVAFLYPDGDVPPGNAAPILPVPMRVGLGFVPGHYGDIPAANRHEVLERIRARFAALPYVQSITVIPDGYLNSSAGMTGLAQLSRLQSLDVIALVSLDQVTATSENNASLAYLTIVGAFIVKGSDHETSTLLDMAAIDPQSATLVMRAAGTSALEGDATAVDRSRAVREQSSRGLNLATTQLMNNFSQELTDFEQRVKSGTAPVKVERRGSTSGGGGAVDALLLGALAALLALRRASRDS